MAPSLHVDDAPLHADGGSAFRADGGRLLRRFAVLVTATLAFAAAAYIGWSIAFQDASIEETALVEARALNMQMQSAWKYIGNSQDIINYDDEGRYCFKGMYCATAAKQIAELFTEESPDHSIRYVRDNPRNLDDRPDDFETIALQSFRNGEQTESYGIEVLDGTEVFRYVSELRIEKNCLPCHGDPAGSTDATGAYREGFDVGDLAGASSIIVPIQAYQEAASGRTVATIAFFCALLLAMILIVQAALRAWVIRPLARSNAQLEEDNAAKTYFLTLVSHELRTPLASIISFTDLWQKSSEARDSAEQHLVEEVKANSTVLLGMVDNIIDMSKVEARKYELSVEEIDISDVIGSVRSVAEPIALQKSIRLDFSTAPDTPIVFSDWEALRQIITNLVSNALKFTDEGGHITVSTSRDAITGNLMVAVADTGRGIPPEDLERIFERFERSSTGHAAEDKGSGLGLSLATNLATMLGGSIVVASEVAKGSTFTLSLPPRAQNPPDEGSAGEGAGGSSAGTSGANMGTGTDLDTSAGSSAGPCEPDKGENGGKGEA